MFKVKKLLVLVCLFAVVALVGCGSNTSSVDDKKSAEQGGSITVNGSTSVQPLSEELANAFKGKNTGVSVNIMGGGSSQGIQSAANGSAQIGASSRELKEEEEKSLGLIQTKIAIDGIAVVIHPNNIIKDLSKEQIKKIFSGQIKNWSEVGGNDSEIHVVTREEGSGTRGAFEEMVMGKDTTITNIAAVQPSNGAIRQTVVSDVKSIGYVSFGFVNNEVKAVSVDGSEPTVENIKSGTYKISRPFLYLTKGEPQGIAKKYIDFVLSEEGQKLVAKDYISVK